LIEPKKLPNFPSPFQSHPHHPTSTDRWLQAHPSSGYDRWTMTVHHCHSICCWGSRCNFGGVVVVAIAVFSFSFSTLHILPNSSTTDTMTNSVVAFSSRPAIMTIIRRHKYRATTSKQHLHHNGRSNNNNNVASHLFFQNRCHSTNPLRMEMATRIVPDLGIDTISTNSTTIGNPNEDQNAFMRPSNTAREEDPVDNLPKLMHPDDFLDEHGRIPYPKHLSPSSAMAFRDCPQSFLLQYIYKISQPTNLALAKGSMCHTALEHIFDLDPPDRTLENLQNMLRQTWSENRQKDEYRHLFEERGVTDQIETKDEATSDDDDDDRTTPHRDLDAEREWGQSALRLLENYYISEDPRLIVRPNPYRREVWVNANLTVDPALGATAPAASSSSSSEAQYTSTLSNDDGDGDPSRVFMVRGIVDRLDMVKVTGQRKVALKIVDYKTGKAPTLKYSNDMNRQIYQKNFFQLKIYALLMREKNAAAARASLASQQESDAENNGNGSSTVGKGMDVRYLKLYYLDSEEGRAKPWEMDLGETQKDRDEVLHEVHQELAMIWTDIITLVDQQDPKAFHHCDRSFCSCHSFRPQFVHGTLWEKEQPQAPSSSSSKLPIVPEIF
jgi:PD-(D/E)XK nuclease superfamily